MGILDVQVSWFKNYYTTEPGGTVSLRRWLQSEKLKERVEAIRRLPTKKEKDAAKAQLPAITPSGTFSARNSQSLIKHSGIICIDIDLTGNEDIENYSDLKRELCKLKQVAYCGASVSGTGFFLFIPLKYPERHKEQFQALKNEFLKWGIKVDDKCGNIDRLRGASFDAEAYYNPEAIPFAGLPDKRPAVKKHYQAHTVTGSTVFDEARYYTEKVWHNKFVPGNRHWYIFRMAEYLASKGIDQGTASEHIYKNVLPKDEIKSNCISYPYKLLNRNPAPACKATEFANTGDLEGSKCHPQHGAKNANTGDFEGSKDYPKPDAENGRIKPAERINQRYKPTWDVEAIRAQLSAIKLPSKPLQVAPGVTIFNPELFINSHLQIIEANNGNPTFQPYYTRLANFIDICIENII